MRVAIEYTPGASLVLVVRRDADGLFLDAADGAFRASPATPTRAVPAVTLPVAAPGVYEIVLPTPQAQWPNDDYYLYVLDTGTTPANQPATIMQVSVYNGSATLIRPDTVAAAMGARVITTRNQDPVRPRTVDDCLQGAWTECFGPEPVVGATYIKQLPDNSAPARTFTLTPAVPAASAVTRT